MPDLPTVTITDQAVFDRIVAAFGSVANYRAWLRNAVRDYVIRQEVSVLHETHRQAEEAKRDEIAVAINPPPP